MSSCTSVHAAQHWDLRAKSMWLSLFPVLLSAGLWTLFGIFFCRILSVSHFRSVSLWVFLDRSRFLNIPAPTFVFDFICMSVYMCALVSLSLSFSLSLTLSLSLSLPLCFSLSYSLSMSPTSSSFNDRYSYRVHNIPNPKRTKAVRMFTKCHLKTVTEYLLVRGLIMPGWSPLKKKKGYNLLITSISNSLNDNAIKRKEFYQCRHTCTRPTEELWLCSVSLKVSIQA